MTERKKAALAALVGLAFVAFCYLALCRALDLDILAHSPYDSYSLQAMLWREGRVSLTENRAWLELAVYGGEYYISFPPFPTLVMLPLTFFFGEETPSQLVSFACVLAAYLFGFLTARRRKVSPAMSAFMAVFLVLGCNLCEFGLYGGVWNVAQSMGFALTCAAFYGVSRRTRPGTYASLILIACAVGCRPFQAVYVPLLLYFALKRLGIKRLWPALIVPGLIALSYAFYNWLRFSDPLQFGHDYLPEFAQQSEYGQFSLHYIPSNLRNILRLPRFENGRLTFPTAFGFAFWLCNPLFPLFLAAFALRVMRDKVRPWHWMLLFTLLIHFFLLLMHKSFGGVQFGTRYLCDLAPAMYFFWARPRSSRLRRVPLCAACSFGILFNLYGAWYFHVLVG